VQDTWIIYASCGRGHFYVAQSIRESFEESEFINILDYNPIFKFFYQGGYEFILKKFPFLWDLIFKIADIYTPFFDFLRVKLERFLLKDFLKEIEKYSPRRIILTHFLPLEILSSDHFSKIEVYCFITDYYPHRFWINEKVKIYFVGSNFTKKELEKRGIPSDKIIVSGIPIRRGFKNSNIKEEKNSILIFSGIFSFKPILKIIESLKNTKFKIYLLLYKEHFFLFKKLKKKFNNLQIFFYTQDIYPLMQKAEFIVSKPGGSTISEALYLKKICIFFDIIGGQEKKNLEFIKKYNLGIVLKDFSQLESILSTLNSEKIDFIKKNIENFLNEHTKEDLKTLILKNDSPSSI